MTQVPTPHPDPSGHAELEAAEAVTEPLGRAAALGTLWMTGQKWVVRLSGLVTIAILTRFVAPVDFGVVAAAATVTPLVLLLADLGLSTYIVQADNPDKRTLSTGFWFSVSFGVVLSTGLALAAPPIAAIFNIVESTAVLQAMAPSVLITVLSSVPIALLRRKMEFKLLAIQATIASLVAQVVAVILALAGTGAWALVGQLLVAQSIIGVLAWRAAGWRPSLEFSTSAFVTMAKFGSKVVGVELVAACRAALEAGIISNVLGQAALGYLSVAQRLVQVTQDVGASALVPVTTVVIAKVRDSPERLRSGYLKASRIGYAGVSPMLTFLAVGAPLIIPMMFGEIWEPAVPVAQALAVAGILVLGAMIDHGLHYGAGRPGRWFGYALLVDALTVATTAFLAPRGLSWVAGGFVVVAMVATMMRWILVAGLVGCGAHVLAVAFLVAMVPVGASGAMGWGLLELTSGMPTPLSLGIVGIGIATTHVLVLRLMSRQVLRDILEVLPVPQRLAVLRRLA